MTQNQRILHALKQGRTLTQVSIFRLCGSLNGHKRLAEIEAHGVSIKRGWKQVGRNRIRTYRL
jgi:hypothetical protein